MSNLRNRGTALGRVVRIKIFGNSDGSRNVLFTLACQNNYPDKETGGYGVQYIPLKAFIPADRKNGIYDFMEVGDLVQVEYSIKNENYTSEDGKDHFDIVLKVQTIEFEESKSAKLARQARTAARKEVESSFEDTIYPTENESDYI